jgi:hypothetical protein
MFGSIGIFGSKGMVRVPNISGLSTSSAISTIQAAGLVASSSGTTSTSNSSLNDTIASQLPASNTLVDYQTTVSYNSYTYSAPPTPTPPPPSYPPSWTDNTISGFLEGVAFSDSVSATNMNYSGSYSVTSGALPNGITLNSSTGALSGTPSTQQQYSFTITASNSYGSISASFSGFVGGIAAISLGVYFDTPSSQTSLTGTIFAENTSGGAVTVTLTTTAGTIFPTSFILNQETVVTPVFSVTGLSAGQTITVVATATGNVAQAQKSETTVAATPTPTPSPTPSPTPTPTPTPTPGCTVGGGCYISYSCATVGCSFCCPDPCYRSGTYDSSCDCTSPGGPYFC